jgi:hypothetical protein
MNYYYMAATLPMLSMEHPPAIRFAGFCALCAEHLSRADLAGLAELDAPLETQARHPFVVAWRACDGALRNAVARLRAHRLSKDPSLHVRPGPESSDADRAAATAFARPSPLDRHLALDRFRWSQLDILAGDNIFSSAAVLAYGVKLQMAERWAGLREESAVAKVNAIVGRPPSGRPAPGEPQA